MRKLWIVVLLLGLFGCGGPDGKNVEITGVVDNLGEQEIEIQYYKDLLLNTPESFMVPVSADGSFTMRFPLERGEFLYVRTARRSIHLYVRPGTRLHLTFDAEDRDQKPAVNGELAAESQFLVDFNFYIEREYGTGLTVNKASEMNADEFIQYTDDVYDKKHSFLDQYQSDHSLDEEFAGIMNANIRYEKYRLLLEYPLYYAYFNRLDESPDMPSGYYTFLDRAMDLDQDQVSMHMRSRGYVSFLSSYLNHLVGDRNEEEQEGKSYFEVQYAVSKDNFTGESRDFVLAQTMISALNFDVFDISSRLYEDFLQTSGRGEFRDLVLAEYATIQLLAPGNPAPDFSGVDIEGNPISLSDYRGQVVYLDFWASWCGPCMREMPFAKELKRKMANQHDLVFMYVSIDTDEEAWRNTVALHGIDGVHLNFSGTLEGAPKLYNVKGVPSFYIIGRDGKIYDNRAPRPSSPETLGTLMAALLE